MGPTSMKTMPLRAPLRSAGMTRPDAAVALQEATKARMALQQASQPRQQPQARPAPAPQAQARPVPQPRPAPQAPQRAPMAPPQAQARPPMPAPQRQPMAAPAPARQAPAPVTARYMPPPEQAYAAAAQQLAYPNPEWSPVNYPNPEWRPSAAPAGNIYASTAPGADMTAQYVAQYGTPEQQKAKQDAALAQQQAGVFAEQGMAGAKGPPPGVDPATWDRYATLYGQDFLAMSPEEQSAFIAKEEADFASDQGAGFEDVVQMGEMGLDDFLPEGWSDTAALAGVDDWENDANPGPGWKLVDGRWVQEELPPGVSADDPNFRWDAATGSWVYKNEDGLNSEEMQRRLEDLLDTPSSEFGVPDELIEEQKAAAWKQAEMANQQVANMLGSRGIGASGLAGLGFGNVLTETQKQVQDIDFDNAQLGIDEKLNRERTLAGILGSQTSEENRMTIAEMDAELQREMAKSQKDSESEGDIWQMVDNVAAIYEKSAKQGWGDGQAEAFGAFISGGGKPWDAEFEVQGEKLYFVGGSSSPQGGGGQGGSSLGGYAPGWQPGDPLKGERPRTEGNNGFMGMTSTYEEYVAIEEARGYTPRSRDEWKKYGWNGYSAPPDSGPGRVGDGDAEGDYSAAEAEDWQEF